MMTYEKKLILVYRAALEEIRDIYPETAEIVNVALDNPESRGETPLIGEV